MRHDFALTISSDLDKGQVQAIADDLKESGFRFYIETKMDDKEKIENYVIFIALDNVNKILAEAER